MRRADKLTTLEEAFAVKMAEGMTAPNAYRAVYKGQLSDPKNVSRKAQDIRRRPKVRARIEELQREIARNATLERGKIIQEMRTVALSDIRGIVDDDGKLLMPHELDARTAASIQSFKITIDGTVEYKFHPKVPALEQCAKVLGLYERDNAQKADPLKALLQALKPQTAGVTADNSPSDQVEDDV